MAWFWDRNRQRTIEARLMLLADQSATLGTRIDEIANQLSRLNGLMGANAERHAEQAEQVSAVRHHVADLIGTTDRHADAIKHAEHQCDSLATAASRHDYDIDRLRSDLARFEGQARIDLAEYRDTTAAVVLATLGDRTSQPAT